VTGEKNRANKHDYPFDDNDGDDDKRIKLLLVLHIVIVIVVGRCARLDLSRNLYTRRAALYTYFSPAR
jgi:hypothetical protein